MRSTLKMPLALALILALVVTIAILDHRRATKPATKSVPFENLSRIEVQFKGYPLSLRRTNEGWQVATYNGKEATDHRANMDLISHILDLLRAVVDADEKGLNARDAKEYGMDRPELAVTLGWDQPKPGEETIDFANRNLSGTGTFAYFPKRARLVEVDAAALRLLEGKVALDFRDRRFTTFDPDDVEELTATGKCAPFNLSRDGDRWRLTVGGRASSAAGGAIDRWLTDFLSAPYDDIDEEGLTSTAGENEICKVLAKGRRGRAETLTLYKAAGKAWAASSVLAARYLLPEGIMKVLLPPMK
jgi:hypothetical protein